MNTAREEGATLVEFALVLPIFLLLIIGILVSGIAFATQQAVNYAAQRSAESVTRIDPSLNMDAYATRATSLVNDRLASVLGYFPGNPPSVAVAENSCAAVDGIERAAPAQLCIEPVDANGRRVIVVKLAPSFRSLWPGFPETSFVPLFGPIRATGQTVVAAESGDAP